MSFFKNLFSCTFNSKNQDTNASFRISQEKTNTAQKITNNGVRLDLNGFKDDMIGIRDDVKQIKNDITFLYRVKNETDGNIKRIEDKINTNFAIVTTKIDNVIMILNNRRD